MEALCRMASPAQRNQLADSWFTMTFVSSAFKKIKDSEFETVNMASLEISHFKLNFFGHMGF